MQIYDYVSSGGKNLILTFIDKQQPSIRLMIYDIRNEIEKNGLDALEKLNTRHLRDKLWEIKIDSVRIMYVLIDEDNIVFLHICKKQKNKAEKKDIDTAIKRAKSEGLL